MRPACSQHSSSTLCLSAIRNSRPSWSVEGWHTLGWLRRRMSASWWRNQVIAQDREALLGKSNWVKMVQKVSQFGIRTGTFNCSHDQRSCIRRGWEHSTLIMSVPQTSASKGKVMLKEYNGRRIETEYIFRWMTSHMSHRIKTLCDTEKLLEEWNPDPLHPLKMFLFAPLPQPPVFFSSLSVKFTGRIEFIFVDVRHWDNQNSLLELGVTQSAAYILKMPEGLYHYGNSTGEFLSVAAMDTFLRSVQPEVNDLFVLSLVLINLLAWMDLFITQGATVKRFVVLIRTLGTYNSMLLLSWLPILALLQLSYLESLYGYSLKLLRYTDTTTLASLVRTDWTFYSSHPALFLSTYLAHGLLVDYFEKKRRSGNRNQEDSSTNLEWLASWWEWYTSYLLHPIASLQVPSDWEDDPNVLFEHLSFPDLWLRPLVSTDYIKALPTWKFRVCCADPLDGKLEENTDSSQLSDHLPDRPPQSSKRQESISYNQDDNTQSFCSNVELVCAARALLDSCHHGDTDSPLTDDMLEKVHQTKESISHHEQSDWSAWPCNMLQCSECVVCLENFVNEELLMGLPCSHAFHQQCIVVWLAAGRHCCPVCRWPSYKKKEQPLVHSSHGADT
uniref:E3 ubiquitin-protein ligase RNF103-like isoform X2 n=1 Tax=Doryrhamphus excisus TaxID=161450 RepID=UPI0025AE5EE1|nr:E3 ubiquitin-protein ligase RNF103-like isoform X2 [Doryrhamphus excisus]